jgi:hypothetical protein
MKKSLFVVLALIFLTCISCKEKIDIEKEKEAVLKVLHEEGDAYAINDLKRVFAVHLQDNTATRLEQGPDSYNIYKGWDEIKKLYESYTERNLADTSYKNSQNLKRNIIIKVVENSAWLICDNTWKYDYNNIAVEDTNIQIAFFEKINGEWKFSFNAFVQKPVPKTEPSE